MSRNGSGVYVRIMDYVFGTVISEVDVDAEMADIGAALTASIAKDGQTVITANLPMATFRHTGVGNGSARTDYAAMGQAQDGKINWVAGGGTADAITATYSPAITALVDGQACFVRATLANATATPTFAPNGLTARTIVQRGGQALVAGNIAAVGHELELRYDLTNTRWELMNPAITTATLGVLPLAGGTMTGDITMSASSVIFAEGADVVSAATTEIWATDGNTRHITGATGPITSLGTATQAGMWMRLVFDSTPTLTAGSNLILNTAAATIVIEAGDHADVYADTTTIHRCFVTRKSGAVVAASGGIAGETTYNANTTLSLTTDNTFLIRCTVASVVYTFPAATGNEGKYWWITNQTATDTGVRLVANGAESIGGATGATIFIPAFTTIGFLSDGANWLVFYSDTMHWEFDASGTWNCPPGIFQIEVDGSGGGGGAGGTPGASAGTQGGSSGQIALSRKITTVPGTAYTVTIGGGGGGGSGAANGAAGASASLGALLTLGGGTGGAQEGGAITSGPANSFNSAAVTGIGGGRGGAAMQVANNNGLNASANSGGGGGGVNGGVPLTGGNGGSGFLRIRA